MFLKLLNLKKLYKLKCYINIYMVSYIYEYLYPEDVDYAKLQLYFYNDKIKQIENENINDNTKALKKKRVSFIINLIKYAYGL